jgi:adenine-specific DNA-methyltransferase
MANLSQIKREQMINFLETLKEQHSDDESLIAINQIEKELTSKKYGLVWEEHEEEVDVKMQTHIPVFTEAEDKEIVGNPDSEDYNFLLEGDNLHSLKLLEKTHKGKIDVIYIDPPYNTGNSFRYNDTIVGDEDDYKHSKWLSFMKVRLEKAYNILSNKGVIFISVNDFEGAQCKLLCDEIFNEKNFVGQLTWESTTQPTNAGKARFLLQKKVESIYMYAKNKFHINGYVLKEIETDLKYPHMGKFGPCRFEIIEKSDAGSYNRETMKYKILGQFPREGKRWQIGETTARELESSGRVEIVDGIVKKAIYPEDEIDKRKFEPFWSHFKAENVGTAQNGKDELNNIIGEPTGFDTVKPTKLITEIIAHFKNDITVLDFFAGSGTTGQAVLDLNAEDGGNRKFILCTNNENNICEEVTYQRLKTVITGKRADGSEYSEGRKANLKYYKTDFIDKESEEIYDDLLEHIKEMIQLQYGVKVDNEKFVIIMDDDEMDDFEENFHEYDKLEAVFINQDVLLTTSQEQMLQNVKTQIIPNCYFDFELREVGELW